MSRTIGRCHSGIGSGFSVSRRHWQERLIDDVDAVAARLVEADRVLDQLRDVLDLRRLVSGLLAGLAVRADLVQRCPPAPRP